MSNGLKRILISLGNHYSVSNYSLFAFSFGNKFSLDIRISNLVLIDTYFLKLPFFIMVRAKLSSSICIVYFYLKI